MSGNEGSLWIHPSQKINIEHENDGLEDDFPLPGVYPQVPCQSSVVYLVFAHLM